MGAKIREKEVSGVFTLCGSAPAPNLSDLTRGIYLLVESSPGKDSFVGCHQGGGVFKGRGQNHAVCGIAVKGPQLTRAKSS